MIPMIFAVVVVLSAVILLHEGGHFLAARLMGVAVEEFGVGFPPRLFAWRTMTTTYSLNLLPLGGFVRLKGEEGTNAETDSFAAQRPWRRAIVVASGVAINAVSAYFMLVIVATFLGTRVGVPMEVAGALLKDQRVEIVNVQKGSPAQEKDVRVGDILRRVAGERVTTTEQAIAAIQSSPTPTTLTIERSQSIITIVVERRLLADGSTVGIGAFLTQTAIVRYPLLASLRVAAEQWWWMFTNTIEGIKTIGTTFLATARLPKDVSGPIGIAVIIGHESQRGWDALLMLAALISINLALLNSLPIPALDGGRFALILLEALRRKPVPAALELRFHQVGFIVLLVLVLMVTVADIQRLVS